MATAWSLATALYNGGEACECIFATATKVCTLRFASNAKYLSGAFRPCLNVDTRPSLVWLLTLVADPASAATIRERRDPTQVRAALLC